MNQSINKSINQSVSQSINQSINQLINQQPTGDHYVCKLSATVQPTRPTQPFILPGSINEGMFSGRVLSWRHLVNAYGVISLVRLIAAA